MAQDHWNGTGQIQPSGIGSPHPTVWMAFLGVVIGGMLCGMTTHASEIGQVDPRQMEFPTVEFHPPEPKRVVLENGMVVYLLEDHELPLVTMASIFRTGAWLDPEDRVGLASFTGSVMRTGGTQAMDPKDVDEELEHIAATLSVGIGRISGGASLDVLKNDLGTGLRIFADILMTPRFDPQRLELAKLQALESIRRRYDRPQSIADYEFPKLLYGPTHPFARRSSVESVSAITQQDLIDFHRNTIHPNGMIVGVTGDFHADEMLALLRETFGGWQQGTVPDMTLPPVSAPTPSSKTKGTSVVHLVGKETSQAHLRLGHLSVKEDDPDYPALAILNDILGGGSFRSRLFQDVRTRQGLAYTVGSVLRPGVWEQGAFLMYAETKVESADTVIASLVANLERLRKEPVTDQELAEAKEAFVNSFVFSFTNPSRIVRRLMSLEYDGLPKDLLQQLRNNVVKLSKEDLQHAAQAHLHPSQLKILAVGPGDVLAKQLAKVGEVKEVTLD